VKNPYLKRFFGFLLIETGKGCYNSDMKDMMKIEEAEKEPNIPEYGLEEGVERLSELVREKVSRQEEPVIVEVAGGSASGKTTAVTVKIKEMFGEEAAVISMDDYYQGKMFMEERTKKGETLNWDQPEALNLELLKEQLSELKASKTIEKPVYDFKVSESTRTERIEPRRVIIVEGLFALNEKIKDKGDVKAFVEIGTHGRILRRLLRDMERTGQKPADILKYFAEVVEPMHEKYIESTKKNADIIINNEYSPGVEAEQSGLHEVQLKFRGELDEKTLNKSGAEQVSKTIQVDNYYNPRDRNLIETGEILRIREEDGYGVLTYKGPKIESKYGERPKFEFEIDKETEKKFLLIYGEKVKIIKKERKLYRLDGVEFSLDYVSKVKDDKIIELGKFIEIRSTNKMVDEQKLDEVLLKLGLDVNRGIKESYFEM